MHKVISGQPFPFKGGFKSSCLLCYKIPENHERHYAQGLRRVLEKSLSVWTSGKSKVHEELRQTAKF